MHKPLLKQFWPIHLFRQKWCREVSPGELIWLPTMAYPLSVCGPYRVQHIDERRLCVRVEVVGLHGGGFSNDVAWGNFYVPKYR